MVKIFWGGEEFEVRRIVCSPETVGPVCWDWDEIWAAPPAERMFQHDLPQPVGCRFGIGRELLWEYGIDQPESSINDQ